MSAKLKIILAISIVFICVLSAIFYNRNKQADSKLPANNTAKLKKESTAPEYDLYYLKHPYLLKGDQYNDEGKYDSAIYYYREASVKFEREKQWENYVWVNGYIARLYLYVAGMNYKNALPYLQNAFEKGKQYVSSNHPYMGTVYYYFGLYHYNNKAVDKALEMHNKALEILHKTYRKDNIYTADVYDALGEDYSKLLFDNAAAEKNYLQSIKIRKLLPDEQTKSGLTAAYYNLVRLSLLNNDNEKAQSFCYEAINNVRYVKSHNYYWVELLDGVLATIYSNQDNFQKAIPALKNLIKMNHENNGDKSYLSYYYTSLGDIYNRILKYDSAISYYREAWLLTEAQTLFYDQREQRANIDYSLGMTFLKSKNYKAALIHLKSCLASRIKIFGGNGRETATAFQGIGKLFKEEGIIDSALYFFQAGLAASSKLFNDTDIYKVPLARDITNNFYFFELVRDKASVLQQLYEKTSNSSLLTAALSYYSLADTMMTRFRSEYDRESTKLLFTRNNNDIYEEAIGCADLLYQNTGEKKYLELIFNLMDKRKSSILLASLNENELLAKAGIPPEKQKISKSLQQELTFLQSRLDMENGKENAEEAVLQTLHTRISTTEAKLAAYHEELSKNYPYYASARYTDDTTHLADIQAYSATHNTVILEYFWGEKTIYVLGVYNGKTAIQTIDRGNELDIYLKTLQSGLDKGYVFADQQKDFTSFQKSSYYLYNSLVKPIAGLLQLKAGGTQPGLTIIPDGALLNIPFEVLITGLSAESNVDYQNLKYLVNDYVISYNFSTRFLLKKYNRETNEQEPNVLALSFSEERATRMRHGSTTVLRKSDTAELPGSAKEIQEISRFINGKFLMGNDATEYVFKKEAPNYEILHLAVHGVADSINSYNSRLIFKKGNDSANDGNLYAYEIYNLPLKAKLAVLSACESGTGKVNTGEGVFSISRGFVYAGCQSLVMSYWRVNDNSTKSIMSDFYKQISEGDNIDVSLRNAKLAYIKNTDRRSAHPSNWAAFIAVGNMQSLVHRNSPNYLILIIVSAVVLIIVAYILVRATPKKSMDNR